MSKYTLHYFDGRARAELIRLIFSAAGIEFTDDRIEYPNGWTDEKKAQSPLGQLPYLEFDGIQLPQSIAIARYAAREAKLLGNGNLEQAKADAIVDTALDVLNGYFSKVFKAEDKAAAFNEFRDGAGAKGLANIEKLVSLYGTDGYSVGSALTWADLFIYEVTDQIFSKEAEFLNSYPKTVKVIETVKAHPKIADYIANRKPTVF